MDNLTWNEKLLSEILKNTNTIQYAPKKTERRGVWYEVVVGVGTNHVAYIAIEGDALEELCRRNGCDMPLLPEDRESSNQ